MRSTREAARALLATGHEQGGYFTAKQARRAGYDYPHMEYHVSTGAFERIGRGLYRLASIPPAENDDLIRLSLWSRNRADLPQAVVSHESALILHDLTDLLPNEIHLTVPRRFRKEPPAGCVLHKAILPRRDVEQRTGFGVTTPSRTLLDAARPCRPPSQRGGRTQSRNGSRRPQNRGDSTSHRWRSKRDSRRPITSKRSRSLTLSGPRAPSARRRIRDAWSYEVLEKMGKPVPPPRKSPRPRPKRRCQPRARPSRPSLDAAKRRPGRRPQAINPRFGCRVAALQAAKHGEMGFGTRRGAAKPGLRPISVNLDPFYSLASKVGSYDPASTWLFSTLRPYLGRSSRIWANCTVS